MKPIFLALATTSLAAPALAQDTREMEAHVHGVTTAEIAVEHGVIEIDLLAPGMDVVGFEYEASSAAEKDAVAAAIRIFLSPEEIVNLPEAAGCRLTGVVAHLHAGDPDHDQEEHAADDDHEDEAAHSEFHVSYSFACDDDDALTSIGFPFFQQFESAQEIEAQFVTETGAGQAEIERGAAELSLAQ